MKENNNTRSGGASSCEHNLDASPRPDTSATDSSAKPRRESVHHPEQEEEDELGSGWSAP